jgi:hypothetical protein
MDGSGGVKEEIVGGRAPDQGAKAFCLGLVHGYSVDAYEGFFKEIPPEQAANFLVSGFIGAFADVEDYRQMARAVQLPSPALPEAYGMQASLVLKDGDELIVHREGFSMVDDGGKSVEEVLINAPGGA